MAGGLELDSRDAHAIYYGDGRIVTEAGREEENTVQLAAEYRHKDHLGNVRVAFTDRNGDHHIELLPSGGESSEVRAIHEYYPFGLQYPDKICTFSAGAGIRNNYRFNGIEHEESVGLDLAPFRAYDPAISRWNMFDPIIKFHESGCASMHNNPIKFADPFGLDPGDSIAYSVTIPTVTVSATADKSSATQNDQTAERYGFSGSLEEWQRKYGHENWSYFQERNFYETFYRSDNEFFVTNQDAIESRRVAVEKMSIFVFLASTSGAFGVSLLRSVLPTPNSFNFRSPISGSGISPSSAQSQPIAVNTTSNPRNGIQVEFNPNVRASEFYGAMNSNWNGSFPTGFQSSNGVQWQFYSGGNTNAAGITIKGLTPTGQTIALRLISFQWFAEFSCSNEPKSSGFLF